MSKKMAVAAAALQYSKWLSRFICWIWAIYRLIIVPLIMAVQPTTAEAIVGTIPGIDTIMMANVSTYMVNSLGEKWLYSNRFMLKWLDKGGFKDTLQTIAKKTLNENDEDEDNG